MRLNLLLLLDSVCTLIPVHVLGVMTFVNFISTESKHLAGDASVGDEDDDEPENHKYRKKVDEIKAKFVERF